MLLILVNYLSFISNIQEFLILQFQNFFTEKNTMWTKKNKNNQLLTMWTNFFVCIFNSCHVEKVELSIVFSVHISPHAKIMFFCLFFPPLDVSNQHQLNKLTLLNHKIQPAQSRSAPQPMSLIYFFKSFFSLYI